MNVIKTNIRNKMEDEFLTDTMMLFIEKFESDIAATISANSIIDDFEDFVSVFVECLLILKKKCLFGVSL